jgi:TonB family protein
VWAYYQISIGVHLGMALLLVLAPYLPFTKYHRPIERITWIALPQGITETIETPIQKAPDLPKTTIQEQKAVPPTPPAKAEARPDTLKIIKKTAPPVAQKPKPKQKTPEELLMEKALARVDEDIQKRAAIPEMAQIPDQAKTGGTIYGSENALVLPIDNPEYALYQAKIRKKIIAEWTLPISYVNQDLTYTTRIVVKINSLGNVIQAHIDKQSGSSAFDLSAMRAIERASPFDTPPVSMREEAVQEGFLIEFQPKMKE